MWKLPRVLVVFLAASGGMLALGLAKSLLSARPLPDGQVMLFASATFGVVSALVDWALLRDLIPGRWGRARTLETARARPLVFVEQVGAGQGLSFYGGAPVGPPGMTWPRGRHKPGGEPLSFVMQWECAALSREDGTGLLPRDGALYLFADLRWGSPFGFEFVHARGPARDWRPLAVPEALPPVFGEDGAYAVPYCSPRVTAERRDIPGLLPQWRFAPVACPYPAADRFWSDNAVVAEALAAAQGGAAPGEEEREAGFARPFGAFPHDRAAVRTVAAEVLERLRRDGRPERDAWRDEAVRMYEEATGGAPEQRLSQPEADAAWRRMETWEPVLGPGWQRLVTDCVNVSLGLNGEAAGVLPAGWLTLCERRHQLAWRTAAGEARAPSPNRMFGPPSYVQGDVEELLGEWMLLLELSTRAPIGFEIGEGVLQFMIRPEDLRAGRFDQVKLIASAY